MASEPQKPQKPDKSQNQWTKAFGLGLETAVGVVVGYYVGRWLDEKWNTYPKAQLIGAGLGFAGGVYLLAKQALTEDNRKK